MNEPYFSALAALAGSLIGALSSNLSTWLSLSSQERARRLGQALARKESLYLEFIDEVSKLLPDALTHKLENPAKLIKLYSLISKLRLFAPSMVIESADAVMRRLTQFYASPERSLPMPLSEQDALDLDLLREFSETCRRDMNS